jgi:hypothetical protein
VADQPADGDATPEPAGEAPQGGDRSDREGAGLACDGYDTFGACVSGAARAGGVDGQDVSRAAQERNGARREERGRATTAPSRAGTGRADDAEQQDEQEAEQQDEQDAGQEDDRSDRAGQTDDSSDAPAVRGKGGDDSAERRGRSGRGGDRDR